MDHDLIGAWPEAPSLSCLPHPAGATSGQEGISSMTGTNTAAAVKHVVIGGVDSHADTVHVAVVTDRGGQIADAEFPTTTAGYTAALAFLAAHGTVAAVGVKGTSSYGSGFTHAAREAGLTVVEVNRPDKAERRRIGKSDPIDAYAAARAVVSGRATSALKGDAVAGIRALHNAARSAVKARTAALNQIGHILITAPDSIRTKYEVLPGDKRIDALVRAPGRQRPRPYPYPDRPAHARATRPGT